MIRAVLIDLDGTLVDSIPDLADAVNAMRVELGRQALSETVIRNFVGKGIRHLVWRCLSVDSPVSESQAAEAMPVFRRHYEVFNGRRATIYPGVQEGLVRMKELALKLACITNKSGEFTRPLLDQLGLSQYFELVISGDSLPERKPHPLPFLHACELLGVSSEEAVVIGDSDNDVQGARAAGCRVFCVPYGYSEGRDVRDLGSDAIVTSLDEAAQHFAQINLT